MGTRSHSGDAEHHGELARVTREVAARITARGVRLNGDETSDEITAIADALERFERAVEARGGDLMVDEPPPGQLGRPDETRFRLPVRGKGVSAAQYVLILSRAVDVLRK